ncbi:MAG: NUDIX domain-containing protein [Gammaproteobacteria bacterium]|nr:NUDIX domain-containing protein [Gammaproteobacteria bacterium]
MDRYVVAAILVNDEGQILLCQRRRTGRRDGQWSLPGTDVSHAETDVVALRHELLSTLGIRVNPAVAPTVDVAEEEGPTLRGFVLDSWRGRIVNLDNAHCAAIRWFDPSHLPSMTPNTRLLVRAYTASDRRD